MKYLFISENDWTPFGGSEVLWSQTACLMARGGNDVSVYLKKWDQEPSHYSKMTKAGCRIHYRKERFQKQRIRHQIWNGLAHYTLRKNRFKIEQKDAWKKFIETHRPQLMVISLGSHNGGVAWTEIAQELEIPYVLIVQLVSGIHIGDDRYLTKLRQHYIGARKIYFCSEQNKQLLETQLAVSLDRFSISRNPLPREITNPPPYPTFEKGFSLACVASLSFVHKGHDILFSVLNQPKWRERPIEVNLYGGGPNEESIKKLRDHFSLDNVHFLGHVSDKAEIWQKNHALVLSSRMEGLSLAILEALAYSRIPIVTNLGGAKEIIKDNETGFIADHPSVRSFDEALERAWNRRGEWQQMGEVGKKYLKEVIPFDPIDFLADDLIKLQNSLAS